MENFEFTAYFSSKPVSTKTQKTSLTHDGKHNFVAQVIEESGQKIVSWLKSGPFNPTRSIIRAIGDNCDNCLRKGLGQDMCNPDLNVKNENGTVESYYVNMCLKTEGPRGNAICPNHYSGPKDYTDDNSHIVI